MGECDRKFGKSFEECSPEERDAFLQELEAVPFEPARYLWGNQIIAEKNPSFYRQLKGLILFGYFSSEEIGKNVLNYDPVPGVFIGCMPLSEIGTVWAL